jgi:hypothetical protein
MNKEMENLNKGFEHENKMKIPKRKMEIKMRTTDWQILNTKGRNNVRGVPGGVGLQRQRHTERLFIIGRRRIMSKIYQVFITIMFLTMLM